MRGAFAFFGGLTDAWLSGDLKEKGIKKTLLSIGISFAVGVIASGISNYISNKIQIGKLTANAKLNKDLVQGLGIKYSFSKNGKTTASFIKAGNWFSKLFASYTSSSISSNASSLIIGLL